MARGFIPNGGNGAPGTIRTRAPQIRSLGPVVEIAQVCYRKRPCHSRETLAKTGRFRWRRLPRMGLGRQSRRYPTYGLGNRSRGKNINRLEVSCCTCVACQSEKAKRAPDGLRERQIARFCVGARPPPSATSTALATIERGLRLAEPRHRPHDAVRLKDPDCPIRPESCRHIAERLRFHERIGLEELRTGQPNPTGSRQRR